MMEPEKKSWARPSGNAVVPQASSKPALGAASSPPEASESLWHEFVLEDTAELGQRHVFRLRAPDEIQAGLPLRVSFPTLEETQAWLLDNPLEVCVDGLVVPTHASALAADRIVVHFGIALGSHAVVVSSTGAATSGSVKPPRIVFFSQWVTVTAAPRAPRIERRLDG